MEKKLAQTKIYAKIAEFLEQARREQVETNDSIGQFSTKQKQSG